MIFKLVVLMGLLASPALCSSIKGYSASQEAKGAHKAPISPIQQQKLLAEQSAAKGAHQEQAKMEHVEQVRQEPIQQEQQREEQQRLEEPAAKGAVRYEARPQLSREELAKGQKREEASKAAPKIEQQKQEEFKQVEQQRQEALPVAQQEERVEQQQRADYESGQIELKEEQRRLEEPAPFVQPIPPLTVVEERAEQQIEQQRYETKGAAPASPIGEAEPYAFNYQIEGQSRSESGDTKGVVRGQYTLQGADGSSRIVDYVADHNGFRASVNTNEFGTEAKSPAAVALRSSQPSAEDITLRLEGKTKEDLATSKTGARREEAKGYEPARKGHQQQEYQAKGQRLEEEPKGAAKSAELRAPELARTGFESATAHRAYKAPAAPRKQQAPGVLVRQLSAPIAPLRAQAPAPVHRAGYVQRPAANQRVSFYSAPATGPVNYDDEIPSFNEPEQA